MKFKIGDRVKCIDDGVWSKNLSGKYGTIKVKHNDSLYAVEFDEYIYGHGCNGLAKYGHGWNCDESMLELAEEKTKPILIYRDGMKVVAEDKNTGKTGVAKCNPSDTFDFYTGAKLALERLAGNEKKKVKFADGMGIWCENKSQFDELMRILENSGYKWKSHHIPTEYKPSCVHYGVLICTRKDMTIGCCGYNGSIDNIVKFSDVDFSEYTQKIKVGDIVEIVDTGKMYPTHYMWVKEHVPDLAVYYAYGDSAGYHGKIKRVSGKFEVQHIADRKAYVMSITRGDRKCYLVGLEGLAKC